MENSLENKIKVLYLDDEVINLMSFKAIFRQKFEVFITSDAKEAMKLIEENNIPIVISDQRMPDMLGTEFLENVFQKFPKTKRILLTAYSDTNDLVKAVNECKISKYLVKPWDAILLENILIELNNEYVFLENLLNKD